jgi:hypothetical protein
MFLRRLALNRLNANPLPGYAIYSRINLPNEIRGPCRIPCERPLGGLRIVPIQGVNACFEVRAQSLFRHCTVGSLPLLTRQHLRFLLALMVAPLQMRNQFVLPGKPFPTPATIGLGALEFWGSMYQLVPVEIAFCFERLVPTLASGQLAREWSRAFTSCTVEDRGG